jgi:glycosyltransferase involved in cell wall biosynthesis
MADCLRIDPARIHVVRLGISLDGYKRGVEPAEDFKIGYLARIAPEKGLHVLSEAFRRLLTIEGAPACRLWAAGYLPPENRNYLAQIRAELQATGLGAKFEYHGELDRQAKLAFLRKLSVFSVPGPYADPKGLFLLEAMATGVPVVQPRSGAFTEIVQTTGGGILVEPGDSEALAAGLFELSRDSARRKELGERGYEGVRRHYSASRMAQDAIELYRSLLTSGKAQEPAPEWTTPR